MVHVAQMVAPKIISWDDFRAELARHLGPTRAVVMFCEQTGYEMSLVYFWKTKGEVPREAFDRIGGIEVSECDTARFKGYHTRRFFDRVVELSNVGKPIKEIAAIMSRETGRKVTDGAVKSARFREKHRIQGYRTRGSSS